MCFKSMDLKGKVFLSGFLGPSIQHLTAHLASIWNELRGEKYDFDNKPSKSIT